MQTRHKLVNFLLSLKLHNYAFWKNIVASLLFSTALFWLSGFGKSIW